GSISRARSWRSSTASCSSSRCCSRAAATTTCRGRGHTFTSTARRERERYGRRLRAEKGAARERVDPGTGAPPALEVDDLESVPLPAARDRHEAAVARRLQPADRARR